MRNCSVPRTLPGPGTARRAARRARAACALAACLLAFLATPVLADWKDDYARGLEAVQGGNWTDAARYMQSAIDGNDEPAGRVRLYGQRWETYVPRHYAGLAAYKQGDCAAAQRLWSNAAHRAFISGRSDLAAVEAQANKDCDVRLASQAGPAGETVASVPPRTEPVAPKPAPPEPQPPKAQPPRAQTKPAAEAPARQARTPSAADQLRPLVEAYLAGKYASVVRLSARAQPGKLGAQMQLLRAAAAYREAALTGSDEPLATARAAARAARESDPSLRPDATYFPPRFIDFYNGKP